MVAERKYVLNSNHKFTSESQFEIVNFYFFQFQSLSRDRDGILYAELDLNMYQQIKDKFGFEQSQRWPEYIENFKRAAHHSYEPQIIRSTD